MAIAYLLLGSNIKSRVGFLEKSRQLIEEKAGHLLKASAIYETAAWGKVAQDDYLNQVIKIDTSLAPLQLLETTSHIETALGRERKVKWGPRTIDIDILFYEGFISEEKTLIVPHPFIPKRRFVLTPLAEIAPHFVHPVLKKTVSALLEECTDPLEVKKYEPVSWFKV